MSQMGISNIVETGRRNFIRLSALGAVSTIAAPAMTASAGQRVKKSPKKKSRAAIPEHRIQHLNLQTAMPLPEMAAYYKDVLEMSIELSEDRLEIQGGETLITFTPAAAGTEPYYHFAFNIPENKIVSARNWLGDRTKLAVTPARNREKGLPNEVMALNFWNSHSVYFWDPAGNILELICRHDMKNGTKGEFRGDEILYASEIGFVTEGSVNEMAGQIKSTFQLPQYRDGGDGFRALGDETGLLVLFKQGGTPLGGQKGQTWQVFPTDVSVRPTIMLEHAKLPHLIRTV